MSQHRHERSDARPRRDEHEVEGGRDLLQREDAFRNGIDPHASADASRPQLGCQAARVDQGKQQLERVLLARGGRDRVGALHELRARPRLVRSFRLRRQADLDELARLEIGDIARIRPQVHDRDARVQVAAAYHGRIRLVGIVRVHRVGSRNASEAVKS